MHRAQSVVALSRDVAVHRGNPSFTRPGSAVRSHGFTDVVTAVGSSTWDRGQIVDVSTWDDPATARSLVGLVTETGPRFTLDRTALAFVPDAGGRLMDLMHAGSLRVASWVDGRELLHRCRACDRPRTMHGTKGDGPCAEFVSWSTA